MRERQRKKKKTHTKIRKNEKIYYFILANKCYMEKQRKQPIYYKKKMKTREN